MPDTVRRASPLGDLAAATTLSADAGADVGIGERRFLGHYTLRGDPAEEAFRDAVRHTLGVELPTRPNTVVTGPGVRIVWLGPDEWLITTPYERESGRIDALRQALGELFVSVVDVSGGLAVIAVQGARARDVLAKGCPLDLHARQFGAGQCAQTVLAKAGVLLLSRAADDIEIVVRRSFAAYLWRWLVDASLEYGYRVTSAD